MRRCSTSLPGQASRQARAGVPGATRARACACGGHRGRTGGACPTPTRRGRGSLSRASTSLSRASNFPLARLELPSRAPRTSLSRASNFPLARLELHSRAPRDFLLGAARVPNRSSATSDSEGCAFRVGGSQIPLGRPTRSFRPASGTFKSRLEKRVGARGERLVVGRGAHPVRNQASRIPPQSGKNSSDRPAVFVHAIGTW